ncbi:MAG: cysteine desulfurase [Patescibacteria group bacterium]|nr:cysteine desulfurase [Patescibacteria group bacterium]
MSNTAESAKTIYLDYAATTPTDPGVLKAMLPYFSSDYSNASSMHSSGRRAGQAISQARSDIAAVLNCAPQEIIFTGSGTESDNLALLGIARAYRSQGDHIIISAIEHKAVMESTKLLEREGFKVSIAPVRTDGCIKVEPLLELLTNKTTIVSVMYANNEIGTIQPIQELALAIQEWKKDNGNRELPFFHTDACQAAGFLSLDVRELGIDLMTVNSSKIYGPKGVGILFKKKNLKLQPIIVGGEQESNLRAGTENIALIVGMAEALKIADESRHKESKRLSGLRDYFISKLLATIPLSILNGNRVSRLPNNVHISIPHIEGESILLMLDKFGIEASTGSACSAYDLRPSHVLMAIGQTPEFAHGSIRFSLGRGTTKVDIDYVLKIFPPIAQRLSAISALTVKTHEKK